MQGRTPFGTAAPHRPIVTAGELASLLKVAHDVPKFKL